jgi:hypothetical protein
MWKTCPIPFKHSKSPPEAKLKLLQQENIIKAPPPNTAIKLGESDKNKKNPLFQSSGSQPKADSKLRTIYS